MKQINSRSIFRGPHHLCDLWLERIISLLIIIGNKLRSELKHSPSTDLQDMKQEGHLTQQTTTLKSIEDPGPSKTAATRGSESTSFTATFWSNHSIADKIHNSISQIIIIFYQVNGGWIYIYQCHDFHSPQALCQLWSQLSFSPCPLL